MTTHSFVRSGEPARAPQTGGGKTKLDAPIVAPVPPPRSTWGIVLPVTLIVGVIGLIAVMYASGSRQLAGGFGLFGGMAAFSAIGMVVRNRGASRKMSWGELTARHASGSPTWTTSARSLTCSAKSSGSIAAISRSFHAVLETVGAAG